MTAPRTAILHGPPITAELRLLFGQYWPRADLVGVVATPMGITCQYSDGTAISFSVESIGPFGTA